MSIIKPLAQNHLEQVYQIGQDCLPGEAWSFGSIAAELDNPNSATFVAVEDDKVIGFINAHFVLDECYLNNMAVVSHYRKHGVGNSLIEALMQFAERKDFAFITLEVRKSNQNAISFYEKHGFVFVGERKNFYDHPNENALLFTKKYKD